MRDFRDVKAMAQTLREALKTKSVSLTHSESLELVAKMLGFHDWNELSAKIQSENPPSVGKPAARVRFENSGATPGELSRTAPSLFEHPFCSGELVNLRLCPG